MHLVRDSWPCFRVSEPTVAHITLIVLMVPIAIGHLHVAGNQRQRLLAFLELQRSVFIARFFFRCNVFYFRAE